MCSGNNSQSVAQSYPWNLALKLKSSMFHTEDEDAEPIFHFVKHCNWVQSTEAVFWRCYVKCVIFLKFCICAGALFLAKLMALKRTSANGCFWFLEIYFYNSKRFFRTENHVQAISCITKVCESAFFRLFI